MNTETASPPAESPATAGASETEVADVSAVDPSIDDGRERPAEAEEKEDEPKKPEKTPEQREIERLRRAVDRRTRQLAEERARNVAPQQHAQDTRASAGEDHTYQLTQAQIDELVTARAKQLAPTLREQAAEVERRSGVVQSLAKTWGPEKFDEMSSDLDDAFGGLMDRGGAPKPATEAIFEADNPAAVIEYLTDPDHIEEAERISRMSAAQAGKAIARLEDRLAAEAARKKPQVSKAPTPLEPVRGQGSISSAPDPSDTKAWIRWQNEQERKGR